MEIAKKISVDENIRFGKPFISGTRVPVDLILGKLAGGMTYEEVMSEYDITHEDILAVLDYAAKTLSSEEVRAVS
jgi:uncharacterized protein (DUF433 family)